MIFFPKERFQRYFRAKLWYRAGELLYPWGYCEDVLLAFPAESKWLWWILLIEKEGKKEKANCQSNSCIPGTKRCVDLLKQWNHIRDTPAVTVLTWPWGSLVTLEVPPLFCTGQMDKLYADVGFLEIVSWSHGSHETSDPIVQSQCPIILKNLFIFLFQGRHTTKCLQVF